MKQNGNANNLFLREIGKVPALGDNVNPSEAEKNRFSIYAEDFVGHDSQLFLSEMNRGKKYDEKSKLVFFKTIFEWIMEHIIVIRPTSGISNADAYYSEESLEEINNLIKTFDTGITEIETRKITLNEMSEMIPQEILNDVFDTLKKRMQMSNQSQLKLTLRSNEGFFNIKIENSGEPEITTLVLKHDKSFFDFSFNEESDGTKRLFDLH